MMIEQPLDYDDMRDHAALQRRLTTPICLDESIHSVARGRRRDRARRVPDHQHQAGPGRRARPSRSACTISRRRHGIPVWHGGMLESGIGRAHNIHLSTLPNFTLPGRRRREPPLLRARSDRSARSRSAPDGTIAVPHRSGHRRARRCRSRRGRDPGTLELAHSTMTLRSVITHRPASRAGTGADRAPSRPPRARARRPRPLAPAPPISTSRSSRGSSSSRISGSCACRPPPAAAAAAGSTGAKVALAPRRRRRPRRPI